MSAVRFVVALLLALSGALSLSLSLPSWAHTVDGGGHGECVGGHQTIRTCLESIPSPSGGGRSCTKFSAYASHPCGGGSGDDGVSPAVLVGGAVIGGFVIYKFAIANELGFTPWAAATDEGHAYGFSARADNFHISATPEHCAIRWEWEF